MTKEEQTEILNWLCTNYNTFTTHRQFFVEATLYEDDRKVPKVVWDIRNRIIEKEGIQEYVESYNENFFLKFHGTLDSVSRDKISIISPGSDDARIEPHYDVSQACRIHTRFNVYISLPTMGGVTYYDGQVVETKERGYVICRSGMDKHWTDEIRGDRPRITLSLGFQLPLHVLDRIYRIPADKYNWTIDHIKKRLYRTIANIVGIPTIPTLANVRCDPETPESIPSRPIPKDSKYYATRPRGFPPFKKHKNTIY